MVASTLESTKRAFQQFKDGSKDKEMKIGPSITLPNFSEISAFVSRCFQNEKEGRDEPPVDEESDDEDDINIEENALVEAAIVVVDLYGGAIQPQYVQIHLEMCCGQEAREYKDAIKKAVDKRRTKLATQTKKILIG